MRTNTLKDKVRMYEKMKAWLEVTYGVSFVQTAVQAMDYLVDRAEEPCGCSVPASVVNMIDFFEGLGNRAQSERVASSGLLRRLVSELQLSLASDKPKVKKKARPFLAVFLAS